MPQILIAEDDPLVGSFIERGLRASGMSTVLVADGHQAQQLGVTGEFDLVVLDIALPRREGFHVLQHLRAHGAELPVLVLTGQPDRRDAVACLDNGADDYMTKPFRLEELLARIRACLRKRGASEQRILEAGAIRLDLLSRRVTVDGTLITVTGREFAMLQMFVSHPDHVLSREQLLADVWGYDFDPNTNVVAVHISNLRGKLGSHVIETVRGFGYRLRIH